MVPGSDDASRDILGRGWTPPRRLRAGVLILVGLLFVVNPLVGGLPDAVGLTGNAEYAAAEITPDGGDLSVSWVEDRDRSVRGVLDTRGGVTLLDCYPGTVASERCALESALVDGPVTVGSEPPGWSGYTYHGRLYERTVESRSGNVTLGLTEVLGMDEAEATDRLAASRLQGDLDEYAVYVKVVS